MLRMCHVLIQKPVGRTLGSAAPLGPQNHTLPAFTHPNTTYCVPGMNHTYFFLYEKPFDFVCGHICCGHTVYLVMDGFSKPLISSHTKPTPYSHPPALPSFSFLSKIRGIECRPETEMYLQSLWFWAYSALGHALTLGWKNLPSAAFNAPLPLVLCNAS